MQSPKLTHRFSVDMDPETLDDTLGHIRLRNHFYDRLRPLADVIHPRRTGGMREAVTCPRVIGVARGNSPARRLVRLEQPQHEAQTRTMEKSRAEK